MTSNLTCVPVPAHLAWNGREELFVACRLWLTALFALEFLAMETELILGYTWRCSGRAVAHR